MSDPYRGTVQCTVVEPGGLRCDMLAMGKWSLGFCCSGHADVALVAGLYEGPLPEMPEGLAAGAPDMSVLPWWGWLTVGAAAVLLMYEFAAPTVRIWLLSWKLWRIRRRMRGLLAKRSPPL